MTRQEIAANGITSVFCLVVRGSSPPEYLCPPNRLADITSPDEERAEFWVREIDALEMKRRAEHLAGLKLELIRRPTLIGGAAPYCPRCGHTGSHNPFCGSLREPAAIPVRIVEAAGTPARYATCDRCGDTKSSKSEGKPCGYLIGGVACPGVFRITPEPGTVKAWAPEEIGDRAWYGLLLPQAPIEWLECSKCGAKIGPRIQFVNGGLCEACQPLIDAERVRQRDEELEISVTELAAGMATADFREERGGAE